VAQDCSEPGGFLAIGLGFQHGDSRAEVAHATVDRISTRATTQSGASQSRLTVITDGANSLQNILRISANVTGHFGNVTDFDR